MVEWHRDYRIAYKRSMARNNKRLGTTDGILKEKKKSSYDAREFLFHKLKATHIQKHLFALSENVCVFWTNFVFIENTLIDHIFDFVSSDMCLGVLALTNSNFSEI